MQKTLTKEDLIELGHKGEFDIQEGRYILTRNNKRTVVRVYDPYHEGLLIQEVRGGEGFGVACYAISYFSDDRFTPTHEEDSSEYYL